MKFSKDNPFCAKLVKKERLTSIDSEKDSQYLTFDLSNSEIEFTPGDVCGILPCNDKNEVAEILSLLKFTENQIVNCGNKNVSIQNALLNELCITHLSKKFFQEYAEHTIHETDMQTILKNIDTTDNFDSFSQSYNLIRLIKQFPNTGISADFLQTNLKKMQPRLYSIASSQNAKPNELCLLVGSVWFGHDNGFIKYGVASNYLNKRLNIGDVARIFVTPSHFKMPEDISRDIILVGPGTGLAPFVSFIEEREYQKKHHANVGKTWLFFGEQHKSKEFYLGNRIENWNMNGVISKLSLAFSRDQEEKVYVQTEMYKYKQELYNWIENGAAFYVCGDAKRMAADVHNTLVKIISEIGKKTLEESEEYLKVMKKDKRYQRDVY